MEAVKNTQQYVQYQTQKSGSGCGCWAIGCGSIILIMIALCGGGFYTLFYSSAPLKLIERAIEENEDVEIEGLRGNFMSGFTIDELRFKTEGEEWSNLTNIKFKYKSSFFQSDRIIIEDISVDGGTIYADFDPNEAQISMDPDFGSEFEEARGEIESELGPEALKNIKEIRVDLVRLANVKIINPKTDEVVSLDEIRFDGFHILDGELTDMGDLLVQSSQMNLTTEPSKAYSEIDNSKRYVGTISSQMDRRLIQDMPIDFDIAFDRSGQMVYQAEFFNGALTAVREDKQNTITFSQFNPAEYWETKKTGIMLSEINLTYETDKGYLPKSIDSSGSFHLGLTRFSNLKIDETTEKEVTTVIALGEVDGNPVKATISMTRRDPWGRIQLSSSEIESTRDLWAIVVFGKEFSELSEEEKIAVVTTAEYNSRPPRGKRIRKKVDVKTTPPNEPAEPLFPTK